MDHPTQCSLIRRVLSHIEAGTTDMVAEERFNPVERYLSPARLARESARVLRRLPVVAAHGSQLPEPGDFLTHDASGLPLLLVRGADRQVRAFYNVCRHRGSRLLAEPAGSGRRSFVCPYHHWTYDTAGQLMTAPCAEGFPGLARERPSLRALPVAERHGLVWVRLDSAGAGDGALDGAGNGRLDAAAIDAFLGEAITADLTGFGLDTHVAFRPSTQRRRMNWKLFFDVFLEAYHLRYTHARSIYPMFFDNLGLFDRFHPHLRLVFPKRSLRELAGQPEAGWNLREHANVLYVLFPNTLILVQPDHASLFTTFPDGVDGCVVTGCNLVPEPPRTARAERYWEKNLEILMNAVAEDLTQGESIQGGLSSGANHALRFGRHEACLSYFHDAVAELAEG